MHYPTTPSTFKGGGPTLHSASPQEYQMPSLEHKVHMDDLPDAFRDHRLQNDVVLAMPDLHHIPPDILQLVTAYAAMQTRRLQLSERVRAPPYKHIPPCRLSMAECPTHDGMWGSGDPLKKNVLC